MATSTNHKDKEHELQKDSHSHRRPPFYCSQWLQTTISDLEKKKGAMLDKIQDDGDSFAKRAEMYYKKMPEVVEMVEDLYKSYHCLALNYEKLRSESVHPAASHPRLLSSFSINGICSSTISDLGKKKKAMLDAIIQNEGDSFAKRAEMYYKKIPEIVEMAEDLCKSYRFLAVNFDKLRSKSVPPAASHPRSSSSINGLANPELIMPNGSSSQNDSFTKEPVDVDHDVINLNLNKGFNNKRINCSKADRLDLEIEGIWNELKLGEVSKLVEDSLKVQAELIRRNDEKREYIKQLHAEINKLVTENRALKNLVQSFNKDDDSNKKQKQKSAFSRFWNPAV